MNVSIAVVATMTRGIVTVRGDSGFGPVVVDDIVDIRIL
jgi:hypothetical protein